MLHSAVYSKSLHDANYRISAGTPYLSDPLTAETLARQMGADVTISELPDFALPAAIPDSPAEILLIRHGAFGDLLLLTPLLRELRLTAC